MQPTPPLDQLADIHLPAAIGWWPLAPGWWVLLALLTITSIAIFIWHYRAKRNRYRKLAQQELDRIYNNFQNTRNAANFLHETSVLLRRTALTAYPQTFNASIKGQAWLNWLDSVCPAKHKGSVLRFNSECGQQLLTASYQKNPAIDAASLYVVCSYWLAQHRNHYQKMPHRKPAKHSAEATHV
jgi:hypothetical protein